MNAWFMSQLEVLVYFPSEYQILPLSSAASVSSDSFFSVPQTRKICVFFLCYCHPSYLMHTLYQIVLIWGKIHENENLHSMVLSSLSPICTSSHRVSVLLSSLSSASKQLILFIVFIVYNNFIQNNHPEGSQHVNTRVQIQFNILK